MHKHESAVEKLKKSFATEMARAEIEDKVAAFIGDKDASVDAKRRIYAGAPLYDRVASVKYDQETYPRTAGPTLADALTLIGTFPAVPLTYARGSCVSFMPTSYVESIPEEKRQWKEETDVCGVLFRVSKLADYPAKVEITWVSHCHGVGLVEFEVVLSVASFGGRLKYESIWGRTATGSLKRERQRTHLSTDPDLITIMHEGEPVAELQSYVRFWASDGSDNDMVLYYVALGEIAPEVAAYDIIAQWERGKKEA